MAESGRRRRYWGCFRFGKCRCTTMCSVKELASDTQHCQWLMDRAITYRVAGVVRGLAVLAEQRAGVCLRSAPRESRVLLDGVGVDVAAGGEVALRRHKLERCAQGDEEGSHAQHFGLSVMLRDGDDNQSGVRLSLRELSMICRWMRVSWIMRVQRRNDAVRCAAGAGKRRCSGHCG